MGDDGDADLDVTIEAFDPTKHDRSGFRSGIDRIDNFLKRTARKHQAADFTRIWVACRPGQPQVLGYYAVNSHALEANELPDQLAKGAPRHGSVASAYLSMVGVDRPFQGQGLGRALVVDALMRIEAASRAIGIKAVVLDVIDDGGGEAFARRKQFYERMGFIAFPSRPTRMFISTATVRAALRED